MRRTILSALFVAYLAMWPSLSRAQEPIRVTPCDLVNTPEKYSGKVVQVNARVYLAFEDFSLAQPGCEDQSPGVWLMYGGDEPTPTASTWNDHDRKPGSVVKIDGIPVPLVHDANLDLFKRRLTATRFGKIGDAPCYGCYLYHVTATLTGLFFAPVKDGKAQAGYGHLGCCYLLAIEKVGSVEAERTPIPAGCAIQCSRDSRKLMQQEAEQLNSIYPTCQSLSPAVCSEMDKRQMQAVASLWGDSLDPKSVYDDGAGTYQHTEKSGWRTFDRLKYYELSIESEDPSVAGSKVLGGTATRVLCKEVTPSLPKSVNISCHEFFKKFLSTPLDSNKGFNSWDQMEDLSDKPEELRNLEESTSGRLDFVARKLGISIEPGEKHADCDPPLAVNGEEYGRCSWNNETGTIAMGITLMRSWPRKKSDGQRASSWRLTGGSAEVCEVEK